MNNKTKYFTLFSLLMLIVLSLVGCSCGQNTEATNAYRLPLGESGENAQIDIKLFENKEIVAIIEGNEEKGQLSYDRVINGTTYNLKISAEAKEKFDGKKINFQLGQYNENNEFEKEGEGLDIILNEVYHEYLYVFTLPSNAEDNKDKWVVKFSFGNGLDGENIKNYRNAEIIINQLELIVDENVYNLLQEQTTNEKIIKTIENSDMYYYNTATANYNQNTLTLSLTGKFGAWQWIVKQLGALLYWMTGVVGGTYWFALLIFTLLLRTVGWPIYAKTNMFTSNMSKIQPEIQKINEKYEGKTDQNSKMKQQMEIQQLMKKNHVSMWGCLLPFAQMPIFFAVYQVVQRFPLTPAYSNVNFNFIGNTSFAMEYGKASGSWWLAIIVGITMIGSQLLNTYLSKRAQKKNENFYTKQKAAGQKQQNTQMLIMMIVMTVMMVSFAWNSAGIAFYWIIGNLYQIGQTAVSRTLQERNEEKKRLESGKVRGR